MKITRNISDIVYNRYLELLAQGHFKKGVIQQKLQEEFELPKSSCWDHSVGRLKAQAKIDQAGETPIVKQLTADPKLKEVIEKKVKETVNWQPKIESMPSLSYQEFKSKKKTFIITSWDLRVGVNEGFLQCIETLKKELNAEALIVPLVIKDRTFIPKRILEVFNVIDKSTKFNENIYFEYVPTNPLAQSPLSGWIGSFPGKSVIIGALTKELTSEPSIHYCKQLMTTGSVGYLDSTYEQFSDYKDDTDFQKRWNMIATSTNSKAMAISQRFVKPSALILDIIDEKTFLSRYITMESQDVIYDLNKKITANKVENSIPNGLVLGDHHAYAVDEENHKAGLEMIIHFNPKEVFLNDFFDGISASHHILDDSVFYSKAPSIKEEAEITKKLLKQITDISQRVVYLNGNHEDFLLKLLSKPEMYWRMNDNLSTCYRLQAYTMDTGKHPIIKLLDLESIPNLHFSDQKEIYHVDDVTIIHGYESFARMDFKGFTKIYNNIVMGHFHKAQVWRNGACVGATAKAEQSYSIGANAVIGANCLIQPDGSLQLLPIIRGIWKTNNEKT